MITHYSDITNYITKYGSTIRELMHPEYHGNKQQSFAEARVLKDVTTKKHLHKHTEEIYHITQGSGLMSLGDTQFSVAVGDTICIPPNTPHQIKNTGDCELVILCACSPAYSHEDTILLE